MLEDGKEEETIRKTHCESLTEKYGLALVEFKELEHEQGELLEDVKKVMRKNPSAPMAYAEKARIKATVNDSVVVIKPLKQDQSSQNTRNILQSSFDPIVNEVADIRNIRNGGIIVGCKSKEAVDKFHTEAAAKLGENYTVKIPVKKLPRIRVTGLKKMQDPPSLENSIRKQNSHVFSESDKLSICFMNERQNKITAFTEANGSLYRKILAEPKISIGWDSCFVYDAVEVRRCYKCNGYNHKASDCKVEKASCPKCADSHAVAECTVKEARCCNCIQVNKKLNLGLGMGHEAWNRDCPVSSRLLAIEISKIDFSG